MIPLFDLHCDTLYELYKKKLSFDDSPLHISLVNACSFMPYIQVCAIWSDYHLNNEDAYTSYKNCLSYLSKQGICFSKSLDDKARLSLILAIEDARILNNSVSRLDQLYNDGVRVITLNWKGESCIGGGWDTSLPLTTFGISIVSACSDKKIAIDLSHSSIKTQWQVVKLAEKKMFSPLYTHSNSYSVCKHKRNISNELAKELTNLNGLIGLSLCTDHLTTSTASIYSLIPHIHQLLELGCENSIALGCDFDGISTLPLGINHVGDLVKLHSIFSKEFGVELTSRIFYKNSYNYFSKLLDGR